MNKKIFFTAFAFTFFIASTAFAQGDSCDSFDITLFIIVALFSIIVSRFTGDFWK